MMKILSFILALILPTVGFGADLFQSENHNHILVHNRVLAKVNGKSISVVDVMKKMDILFYRQFPEYTSIIEARFQFYKMNWKRVLDDLIDKELIIADAEESKLPASAGDVRQEMEELFGPSIIMNLDSIGMTFDEAYKIVLGDIMLRRMMYLRANMKAVHSVTPQSIRQAYEEKVKGEIRPDAWRYQVISIRNPDPVAGAETAQLAYSLLHEEKVPMQLMADKLKENSTGTVSISEEFFHNEKEIAEANKLILNSLSAEEVSQPVTQKSRADNSNVFRLLYLKEKIAGGIIPFNEVENQLRDQLLDGSIEKETEAYLKKLRQHFDVQIIGQGDNEALEPFTLESY